MTADEKALLAAVVADPDAVLPRLVYADWLDDRGRPERAELVRLDVTVDCIPFAKRRSVEAQRLFTRLVELSPVRTAWGNQLKAGLPKNQLTSLGHIAGLPLELWCTGKYLVEHDAVLSDKLVVGGMWLRMPTAKRLTEVARTRVWNALPSLRIDADEVDATAIKLLLDCLPGGLRRFAFTGAFGYAASCPPPADWLVRSAAAVGRMSAHKAVARLHVLNLNCAGVGAAGAAALAESPHLVGLRRLNVDGNHLAADERERLVSRYGKRLIVGDD